MAKLLVTIEIELDVDELDGNKAIILKEAQYLAKDFPDALCDNQDVQSTLVRTKVSMVQ